MESINVLEWREATDDDFKNGENMRMWAVRSTLMRRKRQIKVHRDGYAAKGQPSIGKLLDEKAPPKTPFQCGSEECTVCFPQYFPASVSVSDEEARQITVSLLNSIHQDLSFLRQALREHADFIVTRWRKKSADKRFKFFADNVDLYDKKWAAIHLLDFRKPHGDRKAKADMVTRALKTGNKKDLQTGFETLVHAQQVKEMACDMYQDTWFLPYLDSQMLSEDPMLLLGLLYHRTANDPEKWLMFDNANVVLAEQLAIIGHIFNPQCVVMHGPDFGKLVKWNARQAHRWEIIGFTKAHFLLTAQQKMMTFLRKCVAGLLDEANEPPKLNVHPKWSHLIYADFSRFETTSGWSTDSLKPFSSPPTFDPLEITELVTSRHRLIKDELELLQTEPAYLQFQVREMSSALFFESFQKNDKWPFFVDELALGPLRRELYWRQLAIETGKMGQCLQALEQRPSDKNQIEFDRAVYVVQDLVIETFAVFEHIVHGTLFTQRGFERNFEFSGSGKRHRSDRKFGTKDCFPEDVLYWSVSCLGYDEYRPFTMDPSLNFGVIDRLCRTDPKEAGRIGQGLLDQLSDMAILNEIASSILSDPLRNRDDWRLLREAPENEFRNQFIKKINGPFGRETGDHLAQFLEQVCGETPWPLGRKNEQWLEKATASRKALDKFWRATRVIWSKKLREHGVLPSYIAEDLTLMSLSQGEQHLAELEAEREEIRRLELLRLEAEKKLQRQPASEVQTVWGKENTVPSQLVRRSKNKPRQESEPENVPVTPTPELDVAAEVPVEPSVIAVKRDNMNIFNHMFPVRGEESQRSFAWQHFLNAMTDAGFSILQSSGSAVTLKQEEKDGSDGRVKTIVVHRPHPVSTINPVMLRSIAKRMAKWFGWKRELFVERGKEEK